MTNRHLTISAATLLVVATIGPADPPAASYVFPAGARRGTTVDVRVGGVNLHSRCGFELLGPGVQATRELKRAPTAWFEGPILPIPESQQQEDYPKDMAGKIVVASDAPLGVRPGRVWTAQGAASGLAFVVGDLPEVLETETAGPAPPVRVALPVTVNGRIFPRENVDEWAFVARKGQALVVDAAAGRIRSPLEPRLEIRDAAGNRLTESDPQPSPADPRIRFTAPADGEYRVRIHDVRFFGGPAFVYRLTIRPDDDSAPNDTPAGKTFDAPADIRGRIAARGETDVWPVALKKGIAYELDLFARRLDSPLRPVMTVRDAAGKEVAKFDSVAQNGTDPTLRFTPPTDGVYRVEIADRFRSRGGPTFGYRLTVAAASTTPDFRLVLGTDVLAVPRGGKAKLKVSIERTNGFKDPIELTVNGLPSNVRATRTTVAPNQNLTEIPLDAGPDAAIDAARVTVRGTAKAATRTASIPATRGMPELDTVLLAVTIPTPFEVKADYQLSQAPRGTVYRKTYRIDRKGFAGPVTVTLADRQARHLQGVTGPTLIVSPGKNEFEYPITLPPWMETGRTCRACVMAVGEITDKDGRVHEVSFSSVEQHMQMIAVVEPGRLGLELGRTSLRADAGQTGEVAVRVQRATGLTGPARVEVLRADGVSADAVTVTGDTGTLRLRFGPGVRTAAVVIRATVMENGRAVTAEASVDLVSDR